MWFKQIQVFQVTSSMPRNEDVLEEQLENLAFSHCGPHTPFTAGWIAPIDEDDEIFVHSYKNYRLFCLQIEEKVLPAYVIRQELKEKVKEIESIKNRKVSHKEKYAIKDDIYKMLLPQAFSRITKVYAYFDTSNKRLILNTTNAKKTEVFTTMLQKTIDGIALGSLPLKNLHTIMTNWILRDNCPKLFSVEDACVLKDPAMASKIIRFKGQDLFSDSIKLFLEEGYKVDQIVISWQDRATFVLKENFTFGTIRYTETILAATKEYEGETPEEEFAANFIIMTDIIDSLLDDLLKTCEKKNND
jgi:recombination associated protein RdgC